MATKTITICDGTVHDDEDPRPPSSHRVSITINGNKKDYDLCDDCLEGLSNAEVVDLPSCVPATTKARSRSGGGSRKGRDGNAVAIRAFAEANKLKIPAKGRIPSNVREAWVAAGSPGAV